MDKKQMTCKLIVVLCCSLLAINTVYADISPEIFFAEELIKQGYSSLAEDHLSRTRNRQFLPAAVRIEAMRRLASLYREQGRRAEEERDFASKRRFYSRSINEYSRFLEQAGEDLDRLERHNLLHEKGELAYNLAIDAAESMRATIEEDERAEYRKSALRWFEMAQNTLQDATEFLTELRDTLEKAITTDEDRNYFQKIQRLAGQAAMDYGSAIFEHARLFRDEEQQYQAFQNAISVYEGIAESYSHFTIRYQAYREIGQCYRYMREYDDAVIYFNRALEVEDSPATRWDRRIARLYLAETCNEWGELDPEMYDRAVVSSDALITEVQREADATADADAMDMVFAAWIQKGKALVGSARHIARSARDALENGEELLGRERLRDARGRYQTAVDQVNEIADNPDTRWARDAREFIDDWIEESGEVLDEPIEVRPGITTYMAEGVSRFQEERYRDSITSFMKALEVGDPYVYGETLIPEAWYRMGLAYYYLSSPDRVSGNHNYYYEAALCFEKIARDHTEAEFASDAAYYGQQFYGALFQQTRALVERGRLTDFDLRADGQRYYSALENFNRHFSDDPRSDDLQFQAAEVARAIGDFEEAAEIYAGIMQEHYKYFEAKFRAGYSLYLAALDLFEKNEDDPPTDKIGELLVSAGERYSDYITWYENNKDFLDPEELETLNKWIVRTKVEWGRLLIHNVWVETFEADEGADKALTLLDGIENQHLEGPERQELRAEYLPDSYFIIIQAYRRKGELEEAEVFVDSLAEEYGQHDLSSSAAGLLGYAYLQRRQNLEEEDADRLDIDYAARQAGRYLSLSLELDPEQNMRVYIHTAAQLYEMDEFGEAVNIIQDGLERFPIDNALALLEEGGTGWNELVEKGYISQSDLAEGEYEEVELGDKIHEIVRVHMRAVESLAECYRAMEEWARVQDSAERLLNYERRINAATGQERRNIDYRRDYAIASEELELWQEAAGYWREVKTIAENMSQTGEGETVAEGDKIQFEATVALARCHAEMGNIERGHNVLAWYLLSSGGWLRKPEWGQKVQDLYDRYFQDSLADLEDLVFQQVEADPNLLRVPESRQLIVNMVDSYWPEREDQLKRSIEAIEAEI